MAEEILHTSSHIFLLLNVYTAKTLHITQWRKLNLLKYCWLHVAGHLHNAQHSWLALGNKSIKKKVVMQPQVYKYTQTDVLVTFIEQGFFFTLLVETDIYRALKRTWLWGEKYEMRGKVILQCFCIRSQRTQKFLREHKSC